MPPSQTTQSQTLLYVVTEDWFFRSHFLPMAWRARDDGWRVVIAARLGPAADDLRAEGFETVPLGAMRGGGPVALIAMVQRLRALVRDLRPGIVHLISLKPVVVGGLALTGNRDVATVLAVTGLGFLGTARSAGARLGLRLARWYLRRLGRRPRAAVLLENTSDRAWLWPEGTDELPVAPVILPGAGVDPDRFEALPEPAPPPVKVGLVARMLWSKGIDVAVAAVDTLKSRGIAVELDLFGAPDDDNPRAFSRAQLTAFSAPGGVAWHGATADVAGGVGAHARLRAAVAGRRGAAAQHSGGRRVRPADRHHGRARLSRLRPGRRRRPCRSD